MSLRPCATGTSSDGWELLIPALQLYYTEVEYIKGCS